MLNQVCLPQSREKINVGKNDHKDLSYPKSHSTINGGKGEREALSTYIKEKVITSKSLVKFPYHNPDLSTNEGLQGHVRLFYLVW